MSRGVDAERDTTDEPCRFLGLFAQPPDTKRAGRCPAVFCASSAGSRFHFGNLGGAAAAKTCKPLTSRTPANIGVHGPCYEMDDHALRSSRLKSSPLRLFFLHHFPSCETEKLHHFPKYDIREALSRCRREGRSVAPTPIQFGHENSIPSVSCPLCAS